MRRILILLAALTATPLVAVEPNEYEKTFFLRARRAAASCGVAPLRTAGGDCSAVRFQMLLEVMRSQQETVNARLEIHNLLLLQLLQNNCTRPEPPEQPQQIQLIQPTVPQVLGTVRVYYRRQ